MRAISFDGLVLACARPALRAYAERDGDLARWVLDPLRGEAAERLVEFVTRQTASLSAPGVSRLARKPGARRRGSFRLESSASAWRSSKPLPNRGRRRSGPLRSSTLSALSGSVSSSGSAKATSSGRARGVTSSSPLDVRVEAGVHVALPVGRLHVWTRLLLLRSRGVRSSAPDRRAQGWLASTESREVEPRLGIPQGTQERVSASH